MKLRIRGNSVRLRLSKTELAQIEEQGYAEDSIRFPAGPRLRYRLEVKPGGAPTASYSEGLLAVAVPQSEVQKWLAPVEVSISGEQPLDDGAVLKILVEKDFECLVPRPGEEGEDLFENPRAGR